LTAPRRPRHALLAVAILLSLSGAGGCEEGAVAAACKALPDPSGCPLARGGSCSDRSCSAIYSCQEGAWQLVERCAQATDADASVDGGAGADGGLEQDAQSCQASPSAGPSCPPLQDGECDARYLDACPEGACDTGCEVYLRCEGGDWSAGYAGYCDADGTLHRNP
jgi:hypothetical protein